MKLHCVLCGRPMLQAAVYIGHMPVGSTCAKRHNLGDAIRSERGAIRQAGPNWHQSIARRDSRTRDLFEGVPA